MDLIELKKEIRKDWDSLSEWRLEAEEAFRFYAGDQWDDEDVNRLEAGRIPVVFNRVAPVIDNIAGSEVKARGEVGFYPREVGDVEKSEILSGAGEWFLDKSGADFVESEAFANAMICGVGPTETRVVNDENPKGEPYEEAPDPLEIGYDRHAKLQNLVDAKRVFRVREISLQDARDLAGKENATAAELHADWIYLDVRKKPENPDYEDIGKQDPSGVNPDKQSVRVVEVQWIKRRRYWITEEPDEMGAMQVIELNDEQKKFAEKVSPGLKFAQAHKKEIWGAMIGADWVKEPALAPSQKGFKWEFITGKRDRAKGSWFGMIRAMKYPQRMVNSFLSMMQFILASNAKGGFLAEAGLTSNPREFEAQWSSARGVSWVPDGALSGDGRGGGAKIMMKPQAQFPPGYSELLSVAMGGIAETTGVNPEMMGMRDIQGSGIAEYQRREAAMTVLAPLFDSLRAYRIKHGEIVLEYLLSTFSDGRIIRITSEDGRKNVPLIHQDGTVEYDIIVDETTSTPNAVEKAWAAILQALPLISDSLTREEMIEMLRFSPVPSSFVEKLAGKDQEPPTPEQMEEAQFAKQLEMRGAVATVEKAEADAAKSGAEAAKVAAEAQTEPQEGLAKIQRDLAQAEKTQAETDYLRLHRTQNVEITI